MAQMPGQTPKHSTGLDQMKFQQSKSNFYSAQGVLYTCWAEDSESTQPNNHWAEQGMVSLKQKGWLLPCSLFPRPHKVSYMEHSIHSSWPEVGYAIVWYPNLHGSWHRNLLFHVNTEASRYAVIHRLCFPERRKEKCCVCKRRFQ